MNRVLKILTFIAFGLCAISFLGFLYPAFDSFAIIRPLTWIAAGAGTVLMVPYVQLVMRALLVVMSFPFLIMFDQSQDFEDPALRLYQHNLLYTNTAPDLEMVTERRDPDVLVLQEVRNALETVQNLERYPFQQMCEFNAQGDLAVVSKYPFLQSGCTSGDYRGFAWGRIAKDGQEVTIVSLHLNWPWPYDQAQQLEEIIPELEKLPRPVVLGGDLNQVLWSQTRRRIEAAIDADVLDGLRFTLVRPPIYVPIDQTFGNGVYLVRKLERYGSDHNALLIDFQNWPLESKD